MVFLLSFLKKSVSASFLRSLSWGCDSGIRRFIHHEQEGELSSGCARSTQHTDKENPYKTTGTAWENTEYRSYEFINPDGDDPEASLRETKASWRRRRGSAMPLTEAEQLQARSVVVDGMRAEFEKALGIKV